jgi:hypothetical protein
MATLDTQYHCAIKPVSRSAGRSAVAAAAYRAGVVLVDTRTGLTHDYSRKRGVVLSEIVAPPGCEWASDRERLWNALEAKTRANGRVATEVEIALPALLTNEQRAALVRGFARSLAAEGVVVDFALHAPHPHRRPADGAPGADLPGDDGRNWHAHILVSHLPITPDGPGKRVSKLFDGPPAIEMIRARWAAAVNAAYAAAKIDMRQDHRSYAAQGVDRPATKHLGPTVVNMERRGRQTERGATHRARTERRRANMAETAFRNEERRRARFPEAGCREGVNGLTDEQRRRRAAHYKHRLLTGQYGPLDDWPALAAMVRRVDLAGDAGPRVYLNDGSRVSDLGERLTVAGAWQGRGQGRAEPSDAAIVAMVALAKAKGWGSIELQGDERFKERAARAATRAGLTVANSELAETVACEKRRMATPPTSVQPPAPTVTSASLAAFRSRRAAGEQPEEPLSTEAPAFRP